MAIWLFPRLAEPLFFRVEEENLAEIEEDDGLSDDEVPALEELPQDQFFDAANFPHLREELELVENIGVNMQYWLKT